MRDAKLKLYHQCLAELSKQFEKISFSYISQNRNQFADALATLASMVNILGTNEIEPLEIEVAEQPADCCMINELDSEPGFIDIK